jgi:hypothetical protein
VTPLPPSEPTPSEPTPSASADAPAFGPADSDEAVRPDDDTAPLPVILADRPPPPEPAEQAARMRDPFEPIDRQPGPLPRRIPQPESDEPPVIAKMDQIKDLYITAEAIGEDALDQHFQQVSDRQRQLIREYFEQVAANGADGQPEN